MSLSVSISTYQIIYRLGTSYSLYRLVIAFSLTLIFLMTLENQSLYYQLPSLYFYALIIFSVLSILQMLILKLYPHAIIRQYIAIFVVDISFLSALTFSLGGPNLLIGLLFVITIFTANFLLSKNQALLSTLAAVISIVYQQFLGSYFGESNLNNISNSVLLAFLFFVVHAIGQIAIRRFQLLESLNIHQSLELFQLQNINRYILEQIEVGYLVLDEQDKIIVSNPAACSLLGISLLYAHEQYHLSTFQPELLEELKKANLQHNEHFQFESPQSSYTVDIRVQKLIVPKQALTLLILEDTQKLNQKVQQLKLAALGQLSASIAHEIRNPLAAIVQANALNFESDQEQKVMLNNMILKQSQRIDNIIKGTLDLAKNKKTNMTQIHLNSFLQDFLEHDLPDIKNQISYTISDQLDIQFDELQLRQVLINLIRNAVRHNLHHAEPIQVNVYKGEYSINMDIIDFGQGISQHDLSQLFQPFFSTEVNGTGLGLYLSHSICEANQSKLIYVEQEQQGACFRVECPIIS